VPAQGEPRSVTSQADKALLNSLARAVEDQVLSIVYQPKASLRDGSVTRVEALMRWDDPELGSVEPSRFVLLAEQHGLIDDLTLWGLRTILRQWVDWHADGLDTSIAFNISALSLQHLDFPDLVERMCRALDVPTDRLVLELTEGATQPLVKLMDTLTRFRIKGIGLAIDDFGTGYSSLMQLRQLPFSEVKIDQAFVADVHRSRDCRLIIRGITDLAHGLGLIATAEGVETVEQLRAVQELGCDLVQGYLVAPPMDPDQLKPWKQEFRRRWPSLMADDNLSLWSDVETNALGQR
jgi:EAL domain-containing protein (putative c-di-GMP-specific phosphodiesterase class I)